MICCICGKDGRHFRVRMVQYSTGQVLPQGVLHYCDAHVVTHPIGRIFEPETPPREEFPDRDFPR